MMKYNCFIISILIASACIQAEVISFEPKYVKDAVEPWNNPATEIAYDTLCTELTVPNVSEFMRLDNHKFPRLRKITFNDIDYLSGGVFMNMPKLEEVEFNGLVGHFDCTMVVSCPNLRSIRFRGPISTTGGHGLAYDCPELKRVSIESVAANFDIGLFDGVKCPKLKEFDIPGAVLSGYDSVATPYRSAEYVAANKKLLRDAVRLARWQIAAMRGGDVDFLRKCAYDGAKSIMPVLELANKELADSLKAAMQYARGYDELKTYLEILQESPDYARSSESMAKFVYAAPDDSLLRMSREIFNLDSIAGNGSDMDRIKRLTYWIHNNIRHDGSSSNPKCHYNLREIYNVCRTEDRGVNCRMLAIALTEALLAEGIPARYVTCESKRWDSDNDCHVICVAWCREHDKWVWADPTMAAFVTDEHGTPLHPGEVRERMRKNMPLMLNDDANWNNEEPQTIDDYLYDYMAKNLYIVSCNLINQAEPEGTTTHSMGKYVALVPQNNNYTNAHIITTDDCWFWQSPQ